MSPNAEIPASAPEWKFWLAEKERGKILAYCQDPDQLFSDYYREREISEGYRGREILELLQNANDAAAEVGAKSRALGSPH